MDNAIGGDADMQRKANILLCFTLDPEVPHQWKATTPCRQEDGWRTCYLAYDVYKDDFIKRCLTEKMRKVA